MANNQYVNKVVYGDQTLIDLTSDTIAANKIVSGYTAHSASGAAITGTIPIRSAVNITDWWNNGECYKLVAEGYYPTGLALQNNYIYMEVPSSGTNTFYVHIPNGTTSPDKTDGNDWISLTIEVDSNGNSNVTDDTIPANGVSF